MELFCVWTSVAWLINYSLFFCFYSKFKMKETSEIVRGKLEWFFSILNAILVCLQQCNVWNLRIKENYLLNTSAYRRTNIRFDHRKTTISKFTQMFILNGCNNANGHRQVIDFYWCWYVFEPRLTSVWNYGANWSWQNALVIFFIWENLILDIRLDYWTGCV